MKLLATDLDGTFLGGTLLQQQQLYSFLRERSDILLVFVTGRGLESVLSLFNEPNFLYPDYIICDVGSTIVNAHTLDPIEILQSEIEEIWPGQDKVLKEMKGIQGLIHQDVPQHCRCSFFVEDEQVIQKVKTILTSLNCDLIFSAGKFLDVMPKGVNKGSSLKKLVKFLKVDPGEVLVAGDTLNDLAMYECGFAGVVVGNAEAKLLDETNNIPNIYYAKASGAGGILESFARFPVFSGGLTVDANNSHAVWKF